MQPQGYSLARSWEWVRGVSVPGHLLLGMPGTATESSAKLLGTSSRPITLSSSAFFQLALTCSGRGLGLGFGLGLGLGLGIGSALGLGFGFGFGSGLG